ncbi:hypothetical protein [Candidatus Chloroploca sp. Khr17]|uniref:hypothetical protein n=1 Tax=Candidatus Chloroploca sp. Khr17 TaxID=2496869 RepID=UPI00101C89A9|nr:hypothetical protein [Candidatus Chloroploca sp. Khr17]
MAFPELLITINALTAKRDAVLLRQTARSGTQQNKLSGLIVSRIAGGQIAENWTHWKEAERAAVAQH